MRWGAVLGFLAVAASPTGLARAQVHGRFVVGPALGGAVPFDGDLGSKLGPSVFVRQRPKRGLGPAIGLNWYQVDLKRARDSRALGQLRVRPLMLGPGYTFVLGHFSVSPSVVAGYAFNKATIEPSAPLVQPASFQAKNSLVFRPSVGFMWTFGSRWAAIAGAGVVFAKPEVRLTTAPAGVTHVERGTWGANVFSWQIGIGYAVF